jgi:hypothetical protein
MTALASASVFSIQEALGDAQIAYIKPGQSASSF